jgi:hypothetical protein
MAPDQAQHADPGAGLRRLDAAQPWRWPLLVGAVVFAIAMAFAHNLLGDGDTHLHIAVGRWIIAHRAIPFLDPFSFTFPGKAWVPHEWGSELILAVSYDALGWGGVLATTGLAIFASYALLTQALLRHLAPARAALAVTLAFIITEGHVLARPHVLAWPLMVLWMWRLIAARDEGRVPSLMLLPVMTLWCNLHGGFVVGLGFCVLLGAEAVIEARGADRIAAARRWGVFFVLAVLCALISPNGLSGLLLPFRMLRLDYGLDAIAEWQGASFTGYQPLEVWIVAIIFLGLSLGLKLQWTRAAMLVLLLHLALSHVRNAEVLGFIAPMLVAAPLGAQLKAIDRARGETPPIASGNAPTRRAEAVAALIVALVYFATAGLFDLARFRPSEGVAPVSALEAARAAGVTGRVLNSYIFGGFLIFSGIPVFIDGRADLYGGDFIRQFVKAVQDANPDTLRDVLDRYGIQWTIFEPSSAAVRLLDHDPGWARVYADKFAVVQRRIAPAPQRPLAPSDGPHADNR